MNMSRILLISLFVQVISSVQFCYQVKEEKQLQCFREKVKELKSTFDYVYVM